MYKKIVLFGDAVGVPQMLKYIPKHALKAIVASGVRPQYLSKLEDISKELNVGFAIQPTFKSKNYQQFYNWFVSQNFDILFCNCYSLIIRPDILKSINYNAINVHWALLPLNRGPNPTQWAIIKGENITGVTMHYMADELDNGDIICQLPEIITDTDTWVTVNERLYNLADKLIAENINSILSGTNVRNKQDDATATINTRLNSDYPKINFSTMSDTQIFNLIRAQVYPLNGAFVLKSGNRIHFNKLMTFDEVKKLRIQYA